MNLYIFNQTRRGSVFGVGTYIHELVAALKDHDINVCVVNLISEKPQIQTVRIEGIEYRYFPLAISDQRTINDQEQWDLYYRNIVYLLRLHIKDKRNLIFHLNFFESGKLAEELKNMFDCQVVAVSHFFDWGFTIYDNPERLRRILKQKHPDELEKKLQTMFKVEKSYYSKVDHIICMTRYMKDVLCEDYGIDMAKISVIPNGLCDVYDMPADVMSLRKKWNMSVKEKIIFFAGRIDEIKGVVYLIRAFRKVLNTNKDCRLIIAGSGDYDKCFLECEDIYSKITFTGLLGKQDLHELYQMADIGVVPSLFEPFGYVAVEMMMHRLPIVTTVTSGLNEVVDDTCGIKIPLVVLPDSVEIDTFLLSEKILWLLEHPVEAGQMGENARKRYLCYYSSKLFCDNMLCMYKSMWV
ncbi:TIGR04157 family glycosyltransferase [Parabacteroides sp. AF17-28]|uniref:TIGR04157 family glycosyltransferase n=1 Tax=Parabacteroides sp. AF17-28 TaxID=2292241 RepID=UPI000F006A59|nr:TIGR04157 family glycosyltransferase [Parabacteroides sp. AF17-28]RHR61881.1 TIGR04157 family glycosyltransferase [Parabacteroides sp. AF17-28]